MQILTTVKIMLIQFKVANFRSFGSEVTLSLEAVKAFKDHAENVVETNRRRVLRSAAIYGANASGKSNLVKAFAFMQQFVLFSAGQNSTVRIPTEPFKLERSNLKEPSLFEVSILLDEGTYRYGFQVTTEKVVTEWLLFSTGPRNKERILFSREEGKISVSDEYAEGRGHEQETRGNALFLSLMDSRNDATAGKIVRWYAKCKILFGKNEREYRLQTNMFTDTSARRYLGDSGAHDRWLNFIRQIDNSIIDVKFSKTDLAKFSDLMRKGELWPPGYTLSANGFKVLRQQTHDGKPCGNVEFDLENEESSGTDKFLGLAVPWLDILENGRVAFVDELEARLHPQLTRRLVQFFLSPKTNPFNAQLVFVTHDTNLLTYGNLRRDQIWFCEKKRDGATDLYSLAEIKVRKNAKHEESYIRGRYGAIPFFGDLSMIVNGGDCGQANQKDRPKKAVEPSK